MAASSAAAKRCLYEVLGGLSRECTPEEIRSAYRKLALQRHPDKLVKSGISEAEATSQFQELVNAYEVLSDPRERAWYDSHRSQILFSNNNNNNSSSSSSSPSVVPDLFSFFSNSVYTGYGDTGKGFFKVYAQVFDSVYSNEVNFARKLGLGLPKEAPLFGNLDSPYVQVTAFYSYWFGFVTMMDFCWVDQYDAMAGPNRKSRRVMEDENKKLRKKARREYNDTVRGLAEFVKKRDKRVIDMQVKRKEEMERKKEEERERKKELEREKAERAMKYEEPEWAKVDDAEEEGFDESLEEEDEKKNELYCVVCGKKFKSDKQWKNHEQSKKHKEKVAELRRTFREEDKAAEVDGEEEAEEEEEELQEDGTGYLSADDGVNGVTEQFENDLDIEDHEIDDSKTQSSHDDDDDDGSVDMEDVPASKGLGTSLGSGDDDGSIDMEDVPASKGLGTSLGSGDDESSILEAMLSGRKKSVRLKQKPKASAQQVEVDVDGDDMDFKEYNSVKDTRRNRGGRRRKGRKPEEEAVRADVAETDNQAEGNNVHEDESHVEEAPSHIPQEIESESETDVKRDDQLDKSHKPPKQTVKGKRAPRKEKTKPKNALRGQKQKATTAKVSANVCEKCGEEFESRNRLHKHLDDTGHAATKHR